MIFFIVLSFQNINVSFWSHLNFYALPPLCLLYSSIRWQLGNHTYLLQAVLISSYMESATKKSC